MRRIVSSTSVLLALSLGGVQPLGAQSDPLDRFVGPVRQWSFDQCFTGTIPNADRTGLTTGQAFCAGGVLTVGTRQTTPIPGSTAADWIAQFSYQTFAPGVLTPRFDSDVDQQLTFLKGGQLRNSTTNVGPALLPSLTFGLTDCWGPGCIPQSPAVQSLDQYTPVSMWLRYEAYLDAPGWRPGSPALGDPPQMAGRVMNFQAVTVTPEPGTWALLGTGLLTLGAIAARRRKRADA